MENIKLFLFNSFSIAFGFIIFTLFLYLMYKIFYKEDDDSGNGNILLRPQIEKSEDLFDGLESVGELEIDEKSPLNGDLNCNDDTINV